MQRALDFLKNHVEIAFATSEGNRPHIRIFQIMKMEDATLFFATSPEKEVYRQLLENPFVEMMANEGKEFIKVNGKADFGWMKKRRSGFTNIIRFCHDSIHPSTSWLISRWR